MTVWTTPVTLTGRFVRLEPHPSALIAASMVRKRNACSSEHKTDVRYTVAVPGVQRSYGAGAGQREGGFGDSCRRNSR